MPADIDDDARIGISLRNGSHDFRAGSFFKFDIDVGASRKKACERFRQELRGRNRIREQSDMSLEAAGEIPKLAAHPFIMLEHHLGMLE